MLPGPPTKNPAWTTTGSAMIRPAVSVLASRPECAARPKSAKQSERHSSGRTKEGNANVAEILNQMMLAHEGLLSGDGRTDPWATTDNGLAGPMNAVLADQAR